MWVSDSPRLAALLRTTGRDEASADVADALNRACTRGASAWPTLEVPDEDIGAAIGAAIIDEPARMDEVDRRLRAHLAAGETLGIDLRVEDGALCFDYRWALLTADAP